MTFLAIVGLFKEIQWRHLFCFLMHRQVAHPARRDTVLLNDAVREPYPPMTRTETNVPVVDEC